MSNYSISSLSKTHKKGSCSTHLIIALLSRSLSVKGSSTEKKQQKKSVKFPPNILMQQAITDGDVQEIKQLIINYGKEVVNAPEPTGLPSVMCCIFEGQLAPLELLVAAEADLDTTRQ